jgi:hypothetical protein
MQSKPLRQWGIECFVALSLTIYLLFLLSDKAEAPRISDGNVMNIYLFTYMSRQPPYTSTNMIADFGNWRARVAGPVLTGWLWDTTAKIYSKLGGSNQYVTVDGYNISIPGFVFSGYHAAWLFLLFALLIIYRRDALWLMLGIFSGLMYNLIVPSGEWFYPWDFPVMFFFTWACLLFDRRQLIPFLVVIGLGSLFKETVLCCSLLLLVDERMQLKKRFVIFAGLAVTCLLLRKLAMRACDVHTIFFDLNNVGSLSEMFSKTAGLLGNNVRLLFSAGLNHVIFVNAGSLLLLLLLPNKDRRVINFKVLAGVFIAGQFLCGSIHEFRIWYEVLPLGWILVSEAYAGFSNPASSTETGQCLVK